MSTGLAHSWGTSFSRALPSTAYPPYLANSCGPPTFQHSNFTNIFPYSGSTTEMIQQTMNTSAGNTTNVRGGVSVTSLSGVRFIVVTESSVEKYELEDVNGTFG